MTTVGATPRPVRPLERMLAQAGRLYPLLSGCGSLANSRFASVVLPGGPEPVWCDVEGFRCLVPLNDYVGRAIFLFGDLDRKVAALIQRCVDPGDVALDVGANLGVTSLLLARRVAPYGKVHAFEPSPTALAFLERTLARNADAPIVLQKIGLGATSRQGELHVPAGNAGAATMLAENAVAGSETYSIYVGTASEYIRRMGITQIKFMKIDVEGLEEEVLLGLFDEPRAIRPSFILFETNSGQDNSAFRLLREHDYEIWGIPRAVAKLKLVPAGSAQCHDHLAVHQTVRAEFRSRLPVATNRVIA